jgi:hypothetical protein
MGWLLSIHYASLDTSTQGQPVNYCCNKSETKTNATAAECLALTCTDAQHAHGQVRLAHTAALRGTICRQAAAAGIASRNNTVV